MHHGPLFVCIIVPLLAGLMGFAAPSRHVALPVPLCQSCCPSEYEVDNANLPPGVSVTVQGSPDDVQGECHCSPQCVTKTDCNVFATVTVTVPAAPPSIGVNIVGNPAACADNDPATSDGDILEFIFTIIQCNTAGNPNVKTLEVRPKCGGTPTGQTFTVKLWCGDCSDGNASC